MQEEKRSIIPIPGDRNCLFRATLASANWDKEQHETLGEMICDYLENNLATFQGFMEMSPERYLQRIRRTGTWGGHLEIVAALHLLQTNIQIFWSDSPWDLFSRILIDQRGFIKSALHSTSALRRHSRHRLFMAESTAFSLLHINPYPHP